MRFFIAFSICVFSWSLDSYTVKGNDSKSKTHVDYCASNPCKNGGICRTDKDTFNCTCGEFYGGKKCEDFIWCEKYGKEKCGDVECVNNKILKTGICKCEEYQWFNKTSKTCEVDYCASNPCKNGGTCTNKEGAYHCRCPEIYGGVTCEDIIWCDTYGKEKCGELNCVNDKILKTGYCECEEYQYFNNTSKMCEAISGCIPRLLKGECNLPHETCKNGECECEPNYKYINKKSECAENVCGSMKCDQNAKCMELGSGKALCVCNKGYFMKNNKCIKFDLCLAKPCTQKCEGGVCSCQKGFDLDDDKVTCVAGKDAPKCDLECGVVGTCEIGTENKCVCPPPSFVSKENKCIDYCTAYKKPPPFTCPTDECEPTNDAKGFRCKCEDPYELDDDKVHCKRKQMCKESYVLEKCEQEAASCKENLTNAEGYECYCEDGFVREDGVCKSKCDIKANRNKCAAQNAICELDDKMEVNCKCHPMLTREENSEICDIIASNSYLGKLSVLKSLYEVKESRRSKRSLKTVNLQKLRDDMTNSLKKVYEGFNDLKILDCNEDGNVLACSIEMQLKQKPEAVNKIASPTVCVPVNEEFCFVEPSLVLKREEEEGEDLFKTTKPCDAEVSSRLCDKTTECTTPPNKTDIQCKCRDGFQSFGSYNPVKSSDSFIERCSDIDECAISKCPDTTHCENTYGDYNCYCKDKYKKKGDNSDPKKDGCEPLCSPSPCVNGTCVIVGNHGFSCKCDESFTGMFCNETVAGRPMDQRNAAIVGGVLGTLLLIVLIAGYVLYRKMQNDKEEEDDYTKHRQRGILTEMTRPSRRQNDRDNDIELQGRSRNSRFPRQDSGEYRRGFQEERMIPRVQASRGRDENLDDRNVSSDPELSRRPGQRELREERRNPRNVSKMQYSNRGYEEE